MYLSNVFIRRNKVSIAILMFLVLFTALHYAKPSILYTKEGGFREFGVGYSNKTVLPIWVFSIVLAILSYLAVSYYLMYYA
jgi:hypothetical protein